MRKKKKNYNTVRPIASQMADIRVEDRMEEKRRNKKRLPGKKKQILMFLHVYVCVYM
jgi:hypothetical protein